MNSALLSSKSNEWKTPLDFFKELDREFHFTLDPCSTDENAKCPKHFTIKEDGLVQSWKGETVFCNPPYGLELPKWIKKCFDESRGGGQLLSCLSLPGRIHAPFMNTYTTRRRFVLFVVVLNLEVREIALRFPRCLSFSKVFPNMIHIDTFSRMIYDMVEALDLNPVSVMKRGFFVYSQTSTNGGESVARRAMMRNPKYMTEKQIYNDPRYQMARAECIRLAGGKCQECRRYGRMVDATMAHHIQTVREHPEKAFLVSNLRALCDACHNKEHPEKGGSRGRRH